MKVISTKKAPAAIGPYSQAIRISNLVYTSGQIPIDPTTGTFVESGIKEQAEIVGAVGVQDMRSALRYFRSFKILCNASHNLFKDCKQNLGLGKYQMRNFSSQIAMTAITAMQYNLLSTARRFSDYETIGGLFGDAVKGSVELTLIERIWDIMLELVREIAECFNIEDEQIFDMLVNRSDKLSHFIEIYQLKLAS